VSTAPTLLTPLATYRNDSPYPFCPGCGHSLVLDALNRALVELQLDPRRVVLVSDIGCSGLSDQYFATSAFHGLHGRSITYASGIKLARPDLKVVVLMGDGGTGIGGAHLLNAARRNMGVTVVVFNNLNFGMTGGQHSTTTPAGAVTSTTRTGNLERPLDLCATVGVNGAAYAWRGTTWDKDLAARMAEAIAGEGFALLDVWELCTAYYVPANRFNRKALEATMAELGLATGVLTRRQLPEYAAAYRQATAAERGRPTLAPRPLPVEFSSSLARPFRLVAAGSAGGRVRSAVRLAAQAAVLSGLWAAQQDDYPVTVQTGFSLSRLILSPEEIGYTGVTRPDALVVLSADGARKAAPYLPLMTEDDRLFALPGFAGAATRAATRVLDPAAAGLHPRRGELALVALTAALAELDLFPLEALEAAARRGDERYRADSLAAIEAGRALAAART
jgi:2-oxoglutarate/2-oxoacid ferredoxin oxidoreductase subunit beta